MLVNCRWVSTTVCQITLKQPCSILPLLHCLCYAPFVDLKAMYDTASQHKRNPVLRDTFQSDWSQPLDLTHGMFCHLIRLKFFKRPALKKAQLLDSI